VLKITIIAIGKIKEAYLQAGIDEYAKRMQQMARLSFIELPDQRLPLNPSEAELKQLRDLEGQRILAVLPQDVYHIALDMRGRQLTSEQLSAQIDQLALNGYSNIVFSIGGSIGLSDQIRKQADMLLSFGSLTYPHQLMRLILIEQIYRAFKISRHEPYHH